MAITGRVATTRERPLARICAGGGRGNAHSCGKQNMSFPVFQSRRYQEPQSATTGPSGWSQIRMPGCCAPRASFAGDPLTAWRDPTRHS